MSDVTGLLDRITQHWSHMAARRQMRVGEWDVTIWWRPPSLAVLAEIEEVRQRDGDAAATVRALVLLATDEQGRPLLTRHDEVALLREADPAVITRVVAEMLASSVPDAEEAKNS